MAGGNPFRALPPDFERERDEVYLELVRDMRCCVFGCWGDADPHHLISRGSGGSDLSAIPLCRLHHTEIHTLGVAEFQTRYNLDVWVEAANGLAAYVRRLKEAATCL